jgi:NAD(P)-dependent dehydrogenase (short-subunit alcohol dehydrogenase family)
MTELDRNDLTHELYDPHRRQFLGAMALAAGTAGLIGAGAVRAQAPAGAAGAPAPAGGPPAAPNPFANPYSAPLRELKGKTAYVTGASSGIGLGIARAAYNAGMNVIIGYIDDTQIDGAMALFPDKTRAMSYKHDVTDRAAWPGLIKAAEDRFKRVHLLVNNAGVGARAEVGTATFNDYDWAMGVNVGGVFNGINAFLPRMRQYGEGAHIVTTSSMSGILPGGRLGIYTASKFASAGMMEALRLEVDGSNVGCSVYLPGGVSTNIGRSELYRPETLRNPGQSAPNAPPTRPQAPAAKGPAAPAAAAAPINAGMDPLEAGECVLEGVRNNDLFIFSHPEFAFGIRERFECVMASIPVGRSVPPTRLAIERVTMRVPLYAVETSKLQANPRR